MTQCRLVSAILVLLSITEVFLMNSEDFDRFVYLLAGNFSNTAPKKMLKTYGESSRGGYVYFRPIDSIPALKSTDNDRYFYWWFQFPGQATNIMHNVKRIALENSKAVMHSREFLTNVRPPDDPEGFKNFFKGLGVSDLQSADKPCKYIFDVIAPGGNRFRSTSTGCEPPHEINVTCDEFVVAKGKDPELNLNIAESKFSKRFQLPKSWNINQTPCK